MKKQIKYFLMISLLFLTVACNGKKSKDASKVSKTNSATSVKTDVIEERKIYSEVEGNALIEPENYVELTAPSAEVVEVYHKNGDFVKKGDIILKLKDENVKKAYFSAKASLMSAKSSYDELLQLEELSVRSNLITAESNLNQAKETYNKAVRGYKTKEIEIQEENMISAKETLKQAEFNYNKYKSLFEEELISQADFIGYETTYKRALSSYKNSKNNLELAIEGTDKEDIKKAEAAYKSAQGAYTLAKKKVDTKSWEYTIKKAEATYLSAKAVFENAEKDYSDMNVTAKLDGVVSGLDLKEFEETTSNQILARIINEKSMEVTIGLNAEEVTKLDKDQVAKIYIQDIDKSYSGNIISIDPSANDNTSKFQVKISINNDENNTLKKGMFSKVTLSEMPKKTMTVPKESIVIKNLYSYVFVVKDGKANKIRVNTGISDENYEEIISDKVKMGDKVVVQGQFLLQDNESVKEVE